jgi:IS30 family transposase
LTRSPTIQNIHQLTVTQRYQIQVLLEEGLSVERISEKVGVHRSTLYRETNRNSLEGNYQAKQAEEKRMARYKGQKKKIVGTVAALLLSSCPHESKPLL